MVATSLDKVLVRAQYVDFDGIPMSGSVQFTPSRIAIDVPGKKILMPKTYQANLDSNGSIAIQIPASDDPDILPNIIAYKVVENIQPGGRVFDNIQIPYSAIVTGFDLSTVLIDGTASTGPTYLSTSDATAVHKDGVEDIIGIKTFTVSPIVPTPIIAGHPTTKAYVDGVAIAGAPDATSSIKGISRLTGALGGTADSPTTPTAVHLSGNETVAGIKTFTSSPTVPTPTTSTQIASKGYADSLIVSPPDASTIVKGIVQLANDLGGTATAPTTPTAVHLSGNETVVGIKTFNLSPIVPTPTTTTQAANKTYADMKMLKTDNMINLADYCDKTGVVDAATGFNQAAIAAGWGLLYMPRGTYKTSGSFSLSGAKCTMQGEGEGTVLWGTGNVPVVNWAGYIGVGSAQYRREFNSFRVRGSNDPAFTNNVGIHYSTVAAGMAHRNITIDQTGGECIYMDNLQLSDFYSIVLNTPAGAVANDTAYMYCYGACNGNRFHGCGLRSMINNAANVGVTGAVVLVDNGTYCPHDNLFTGWWTELMAMDSNTTIFNIKGNSNMFVGTQFFDSVKRSGATNTTHVRFGAPAAGNLGGNMWVGYVPGRNGTEGVHYGIDITQSGNYINGTKGYNGMNVRLGSGVTRTTVILAGAESGATGAAFEDNSGQVGNQLIDYVSNYGTVGMRTKSGIFSDADFVAPVSGLIGGIDVTNNRLYIRVGSTWRYATLT